MEGLDLAENLGLMPLAMHLPISVTAIKLYSITAFTSLSVFLDKPYL